MAKKSPFEEPPQEKFTSRLSPQEPPVFSEQEESEEKQEGRKEREGEKQEEEQTDPWEDQEKIQAKIKENEEIEKESPETLEELQTEIDALSADYERYQKEIESAKTDAEREAALKNFERTDLLFWSANYRKFSKERPENYKKSAQELSAVEDLKYEFFDTYHTKRKKDREDYEKQERKEREKGSQEAWAPKETEEQKEDYFILEEQEENERFKGVGKVEEPRKKDEKNAQKEDRRKEIARRIDLAYQTFNDARGDAAHLKALKEGVERSLVKYREAVQRGELALPEEELRLVQLQHAIEKEIAAEVHEIKPRKEEEREPSLSSPEQVQEALNVAINNIEAYYKESGENREKIENALNAAEWLLGQIQNAISEKRWRAPEQNKRVRNVIHALREKLKSL